MKMNFFTHEGEIVGQIVDENGIVVDDIYFLETVYIIRKKKYCTCAIWSVILQLKRKKSLREHTMNLKQIMKLKSSLW